MKNNIQEIIVRVLKNEVLEGDAILSNGLIHPMRTKFVFGVKRIYDYRKEVVIPMIPRWKPTGSVC